MQSIAANLQSIREQIKAACIKAGRQPDSVRLIAVSKTKPAAQVKEALDAGQIEFGESYVQEFLEKARDPILENTPIAWHFIGHLQSNKVRSIIDKVTLVHGIDKLSTAEELSKRAQQHNLQIDYLLEVNTSGESSKYGMPPDELLSTAESLFKLPNITLRGLMTIASPEIESAKKEFRNLRLLLESLKNIAPDPQKLTELSMGMSGDFEVAITEGATMIRVGSSIFGWR
ncbi:YggS family pyridoxal phosphate-dependent enzyme [Chlorobium sp. BLA1]|uniref:YggS family pyridoxal phosphate-dependent enzyme n=1 Tax=Candidatus Chlorobium masyuteum TaxID=2716876 RepID=UPI0014224A0A|nr:YggS family pyridoxal phosphate-dependent enzyme [Candidatus Chlorobium masyuteum]NHQ60169.1 YggS family pyridoxal phosphate-dependent enzyme [Candidatus Chlorobium masyuteum]